MPCALPLWKVVTAEVCVHLKPADVGAGAQTGRAVASREAFASLLMRYSPDLGGIVVSHGSLDFGKEPVFAEFVGASPFARVRATAELLLFAPSKDAILTGVVTYVGPDHVALSVLSTFHTIIPLESAPPGYVFSIDSTFERFWRNEKYPTIQVGTALRLAVEGLRASKNGLFHIRGRIVGEASESLGVLSDAEEVRVAGGMDAGKKEEEEERGELEVGRFMRGRTVDVDERNDRNEFGESNGVLGSFDDPLIGTVGIVEGEETKKKRKKKKKKQEEKRRKEEKGKKKKKKKDKKASGDDRKEKKEGIRGNQANEQQHGEVEEVKKEPGEEMHKKLSKEERRRRKRERKEARKEARREARKTSKLMGKARKPGVLKDEVGHESLQNLERAPGDKSSTRTAIKVEPKSESGNMDSPGKRKRDEMRDSESKKKRRIKIKQEIKEEENFENGRQELIMTGNTEVGNKHI